MKAALLPVEGGNTIELAKDLVLVGRQSDCDLRLDHKSVSKLHCVLVKTDGVLLLRDLGSTNGCRVNGQRVTRAALLPNDILSIARFRYRVFLGPDNAPIPKPTSAPARHDQTECIESADEDSDDIPLERDRRSVSLSDLPFDSDFR